MKIQLTDTTFIIPFTIDHSDRLENLNCILKFLHKHFDTNFILVESGPQSQLQNTPQIPSVYIYNKTDPGEFHRTAQINCGIKKAETKYIAIYDCDVIFNPTSIFRAVEALRAGASLAYPYGGKFVDIERSYIQTGNIIEATTFATESVGGAAFLNREDYIKCGLENENYFSHCPDDVDRACRIQKMGYKIERIEGTCWHINHFRGKNSGPNDYTANNLKEWFKVRDMSKEELTEYIKTWAWVE